MIHPSDSSTSTLLRDVEVRGRRVDVRIQSSRVVACAHHLDAGRDEIVLDGLGGALLPGLHDHHIHLAALAAVPRSVDCREGIDALRRHPSGEWLRGTGLPFSVDRHALDRVVADRPVRVQHRSGALWMLNSRALDLVGHVLDDSTDVERDIDGVPTGRLWRYDERLRPALPPHQDLGAEFAELGAELAGYGITSVTDATPGLTSSTDLPALQQLPQHVTMLGDRKILLHDHNLASFEEIRERIAACHGRGLTVAVHCVTAESLLLTLAVLDEVGRMPGDRIEHAAIVPESIVPRLVGLRVVTQPGFIADRGEYYLQHVDPRDHDNLYPLRSLLDAGVDAVVSSDAPYGPLDPWAVLRAARDRTTSTGIVIGPKERVSAGVALAGYLTDPLGRARHVRRGMPANLVLMHTGIAEALDALDASVVRRTWIAAPRSEFESTTAIDRNVDASTDR